MMLGQREYGPFQVGGYHQTVRRFRQLDVQVLGDDVNITHDPIKRRAQRRTGAPGIAERANKRRVPVRGHLYTETGVIEQIHGQAPEFINVLDRDTGIGFLQQRGIDACSPVQRRRVMTTAFDVFPQHVGRRRKVSQLHGESPNFRKGIYVKQLARIVKQYRVPAVNSRASHPDIAVRYRTGLCCHYSNRGSRETSTGQWISWNVPGR